MTRDETICKAFGVGITMQQIADIYNLSREAIRKILEKNGIESQNGGAKLSSQQRQANRDTRMRAWHMHTFGCEPHESVLINGKFPWARRKYLQQKNNAKRRDIGWCITFPQWASIWERSGKINMRGRSLNNQFVMARKNDSGPYMVGNVYIVTGAENLKEMRERVLTGARR